MATHSKKLPVDASVEHLKKQAKQLLRGWQEKLHPDCERIAALSDKTNIKLTDTQFVIAREYGFSTWEKLKVHVDFSLANGAKNLISEIQAALDAKDVKTLMELIETNLSKIDSITFNHILPLIGVYGYSGRGSTYAGIVDRLLSTDNKADIFSCAFLELNEQAVALLDEDPELLHAKNDGGATALHCASERGNFALAKILIERGADLDALDSGNNSPIAPALHAGPWKQRPADDIVELMLGSGATVDFWVAAGLGNCEKIEQSLSVDNGLLNEYDEGGHTALYHACHNNKVDAVKLFIAKGADVNNANRDGQTAISTATLHTLSQECDLEIIHSLIAAGAEYGIESAIAIDDLEKVKACMATTAKEFLMSSGHQSPMGYAIHTWKPMIIKYLVGEGVGLNDEDWFDIKRISGNDQGLVADIEALVKQQASKENISTDIKPNDFFKAIKKADVKDYRRQLKKNKDLVHAKMMLPAKGKKADRILQTTALHKAVGEFKFYGISDKRRDGHIEIAQDLISNGADASIRGSSLHVDVICSAAMAGNALAVELLQQQVTEQNPYTAAALGDVAAIEALPDSEIDRPDENGMTPLHYCSASRLGINDEEMAENLAKVVELLIDRGAALNAVWPGCHGSIESHFSATSFAAMGNVAVLKVLLNHGAPIIESTSPGVNGKAIAHATWSRCEPCLSLLLEHCSGDVEEDTGGFTPYHWIACTAWPDDSVDMIRFIAKKRFVNINALSDTGQTAFGIAEQYKRADIAEALDSIKK
ncbi:MAG: ankyrin repeat domain-containing protein [Lentisphaeria bacterium]|nr:ankyrin repeat domain-containing protein [Lentisphaeria bacterium]NQZ68138.1 ankyrin repeat domain-containing protein [Lentisphaeria bacterium]